MTGSDWHTAGMPKLDPEQRSALASAVELARLSRGWGKEEAARRAEVSSITWKRVEDGLGVQDGKLGAILNALGLRLGPDGFVETAGRPASELLPEPLSRPYDDEIVRRLRYVAELQIEALWADAQSEAAEALPDDPDRAAMILTDVAAVIIELRAAMERTIAGTQPPRTQTDFALIADQDEATVEDEQEQTEGST